MKKTKKFVIAILSLVLALTCFALVLSACKEGEYHTVILDYDETRGTVTLSPSADGNRYEDGASVTVTVTPASGCIVGSFSVMGHDDAALTDGKYTFVVTADTVVRVSFEALEQVYYTVSVTCDDNATATLSPASADGKYLAGTQVTVNLQLNEGYQVYSAKVGGNEVQFANNKYTFAVLSDTAVTITTFKAIPESVLASLRGNVLFHGDVTETAIVSGDIFDYSEIGALYDVDKNLVRLWDYNMYGDDYSMDVIISSDAQGYVVTPTHGVDGTLSWLRLTSESGNPVPFKYYANPFESLTAKDFIYVEDNVWTLKTSVAEDVLLALVGIEYDVRSFEIVLEDGVATLIRFETNPSYYGSSTAYVSVGELAVSEHGEYAIDDDILIPYYPAQPELEAALEAAASATSYKATHRYVDGEFLDYDIYCLEDVIWLDDGTDNSFGYLIRPDSQVWGFWYENGSMVLSDRPYANNWYYAVASFDLMGISPSMFKQDDDGRYVLRSADLNGNYGVLLVTYASLSFATGATEQNEFYYYSADIAITLDANGKLSKVEVFCIGYDEQYNRIEYTVELSFDFDNVELPSYVVIDPDVVEGVFPLDYVGTWICDETGLRIDITLDNVTYNGVAATDVTKIGENSFSLVVKGVEHTLTKNGNKLIVDDELTLRFRDCAWEEMLGTYFGSATYNYDDGTVETDTLRMTIKETHVEFTINGMPYNISVSDITFSEEYGSPIIIFSYSDFDYGTCTAYVILLAKNSVINFYSTFEYSDGNEYLAHDINAYVDGYDFKAWDDFIGHYTAGEYTLDIAKDGITLYYKGETYEFGVDDVLFEAVEYSVAVFTMVSGNTEFTLQQYGSSYGKLSLYVRDLSENDALRQAVFVRDDYEQLDWSDFNGLFLGVDDDGVEYRIEITSSGIQLSIGGVAMVVYVEDFDLYVFYDIYGNTYNLYNFELVDENGAHYWLRQYFEDNYNLMQFGGEDDIIARCTLGRDQYQELDDWSDFVGTYTGMGYTVEVTETGISINGQTIDEFVFYSNYDYNIDSVYYQFSFVWNNHNCWLEPLDGGDAIAYTQDEDVNVLLTNVNYVHVADYSKWAGYYAAKDLSVIVKITNDTVSLAFDEGSLEEGEVVYFGVDGGLAVMLNGYQYILFYQPKTDWNDVNCIVVVLNGQLVGDVAYETIEPEHDADWSQYNGTWRGSLRDDNTYTFVISNDGITVSVNGGPAVKATAVSFYYDPDWGGCWTFSFMVGDRQWHLEFYEDGSATATSGEAVGPIRKV